VTDIASTTEVPARRGNQLGGLLIFRQSIRRKIVGISVALIILMVITSALSMVMSKRVNLLDELTVRYIPAYGHLARANIRSLERALALRRMVIAKMQVPPDEEGYATRLRFFQEKDGEVEQGGSAQGLQRWPRDISRGWPVARSPEPR
jgi:hypothetical protein